MRLSPDSYRRITLFALIALVFIIVTGAAVRLTGSGLGCPDWPTCDGDRLVSEFRETPEIIEFVNRTITGLVSVAVAAAVLGSRARVPRRRDLTRLSWGLVAGVVGQIVLGGLTVRYELTPPLVMGHFLLSIVLVSTAVVLHHRAGEDDGARSPIVAPALRRLSTALLPVTAAVLVAGTVVTGTGPHGGDPDVERLDFAVRDVTRVHAGLALVLAALVVGAIVLARREGRAVLLRLEAVVAALAVQIAIGYLQYFNGVPELLVGIHVLGAVLVAIAVLRFHLGLWAPAGAPAEVAVAERPIPAPVG